jgi:hypothetical protein
LSFIKRAIDTFMHPGSQTVGYTIRLLRQSLPSIVCATIFKAASNASGSSFPRFSARRRIPAHAFELKKNRCGIEPVSSTCDNEHTAASLGQAEVLGIEGPPRDCSLGAKHTTSVRPLSPWCDQRIAFAGKSSKEAAEGVVFGAKDSGHVLPDDDAGGLMAVVSDSVDGIRYLAEDEREVTSCVVK